MAITSVGGISMTECKYTFHGHLVAKRVGLSNGHTTIRKCLEERRFSLVEVLHVPNVYNARD